MMDSNGSNESRGLKNWRQSEQGPQSSGRGAKSGNAVLLEIDKDDQEEAEERKSDQESVDSETPETERPFRDLDANKPRNKGFG